MESYNEDLYNRILQGDFRAVSRTITRIEADDPDVYPLLKALYPHTGNAHIIGFTGPPGAGKSSLINVLSQVMLDRGRSIAVLAVDPSSEFTGGGVLGDRIRMGHQNKGLYFRSFGARGHLGGLSCSCGNAVHLLDAAGFDLIMIETVGTGQSETEIKQYADTVVVVTNPNQGDDVQTMKAGIMEIGDIFVVNKADLPGAEFAVSDLIRMTHLNAGRKTIIPQGHGVIGEISTGDLDAASDRIPPVIRVCSHDGTGVRELADEICEHREYLKDNNMILERKEHSVVQEIMMNLRNELEETCFRTLQGGGLFESTVRSVLNNRRFLKDPAHDQR